MRSPDMWPAGLPLRAFACAVLGALMGCATPPMDIYPMAWLGMVGFSWLLAHEDATPLKEGSLARRAGRLAVLGLAFGAGTNLVALRFVSTVVTRFTDLPRATGPLALLLLAAFEGTRWAVAGAGYPLLRRLGVPRPLAFAFGVYAGTLVPTMLSWTVAVGCCPWPITVQLADLVGERGVAMAMALEASLLAEACWLGAANDWGGARRSVAAAGGLLAATLAYGWLRMAQIDALRGAAPTLPVALVEPSVPSGDDIEHTVITEESALGALRHMTQLTREGERQGARMTVWPEAGYPFSMPHVMRHAPVDEESIVQPGVHGPILTGLMMSGTLGKYNSAVLATRDGMVSEPYDKIHLMWFGEFVPLADEWPWLRDAFGRGLGFRPGEHAILLEAGEARASVLICLEDILAGAARDAMSVQPNLLVNITNDAWFEGSAESELHLRLAVLRAVEARRDMVRAVNMGPTTWVDAAGRIVARQSADHAGVLLARPALLTSPLTPYSRWGDVPLALLVATGSAAFAWSRRAGALAGTVKAVSRPQG